MQYDSADEKPSDNETSKPTLAIVSITASVTGGIDAPAKIVSRKDVRDALSAVSSAVSVPDALIAGEILWAPQGQASLLSQEDVYSRYPKLIPI